MGTSVIVNSGNFATEVLQPSYEKPVLIDFFAQWCGPCQMLKPLLEKLVQEYDFVLAKVDIDANPDLAHTYRVEGVPDVRIVQQGQVQKGFVGMLPEAQIRQLLTQLRLRSQLDTELEAFRAALEAGELEAARDRLGNLLQRYPQERPLLLEAAKFLLQVDDLVLAEQLLGQIQMDEKEYYPQAQAVRALIQFKRDQQQPGGDTELDTQFLQAEKLTLEGRYEAALEAFLTIVERDRKFRNDGARKAMITIFDLLGSEHALSKDYRKRLMTILY